MKILIVSQYFWPENFKINDLALDLVNRGYDVEVLTGKPNYPQGKFYAGYSFFSHSRDVYNGIKINRVPLCTRRNGTGLQLAFNFISFAFFSCLYILFHRKKYDISLTYAISPITQVYAALLHKKIHKSKTFLWVQDLWPESVTSASKLDNKVIIKLLSKMVKHIYNSSDRILVQSKSFISSITERGIDEKKIDYIPNWAEDLFIDNTAINKNRYKYLIPNGFIIMFAGNIGEAQDFESIIKAAEKTKYRTDIKWIILGDGRKREWVEDKIKHLNLQDTVKLLGRYPLEDMPDFFIHADVMLLTLKDEEIFSKTIPSKLQTYMAFGKPVIGMLNGVGLNIISEADCGYIGAASDYNKLAENVILAYNDQSSDALLRKGKNGKAFYAENFSKAIIIDHLIAIFQKSL